MLLEHFLVGFKRHARFEKDMNLKMVKEIISTVKRLDQFTKANTLADLQTEVIKNYLYSQKEQRDWAPRTLRNQRQYLKLFFKYCVEMRYLKTNPVNRIACPKLPETLPRFLTSKQVNILLMELEFYNWRYELERYRNKTIIYTLLFTGMRLNELVNLKVKDIDMEEQEITVRKGKGRKQRIIPIHPKLTPVLEYYFNHLSKRKEKSIWLFHNLRSTEQIKGRSVQVLCRKLSQASGIKFTPHWLRHTLGRNLTNAELNVYKIKEILGHSTIKTTEIYQSVAKQSLKNSFCRVSIIE